jgi:ABC-type methionine transport system permease subunit
MEPAEPTVFDGVTQSQFAWLSAAFVAAICVALITGVMVVVARKWDRSGGLLTVSILIVQGFITASFGAMIYNVRLNPITDILVGALATSMGAIVAHWTGVRSTDRIPGEPEVPPEPQTTEDGSP